MAAIGVASENIYSPPAAGRMHRGGAAGGWEVYIATERLRLPGGAGEVGGWPGGGVFGKYRPALCLTAKGRSRSQWRLPAWLHPAEGQPGLSYHRCSRAWTRGDGHVLLDTAKQGQEFVLDTRHFPEAAAWVAGLFDGQAAAYQRTGTP